MEVLRHGGSLTRSALPRKSTASWVHSFRKGPPKPPSHSSLKLPSFSEETSIVPRLIGPSDFLLDGQPRDVSIGNFQCSHDHTSALVNGHQYTGVMRNIYVAMFR